MGEVGAVDWGQRDRSGEGSALRGAGEVCLQVGEVLDRTWAPLDLARRIAGRASGVAGVALHVRGILQQLWAAISDPHFGGDPDAWVAVHRVRHALLWLLAFINGGVESLAREKLLLTAMTGLVEAYFDASPCGYGVFLAFHGVPTGWFAEEVTAEDEVFPGVIRGDCRTQGLSH
eukprot:2338338-Amphidinium_carterae.1